MTFQVTTSTEYLTATSTPAVAVSSNFVAFVNDTFHVDSAGGQSTQRIVDSPESIDETLEYARIHFGEALRRLAK